MRRPDWYLKQIRERLSIADYAGKRVTWDRRKTRASAGDYWAPCPFHTEKSASFHVRDREGTYKCFGCGEGGDIFGLCMKLEGLNFVEAIDRLGAEAGLPPPETTPGEREAMDARTRLLRLVAKADALFQKALLDPEGAPARAYLESRGLDADSWRHFGIGYAPDEWTWLIDALTRDGARREDLIAAGLAREGGRSGAIDAFRGRIMFPIADTKGRTIAFGGRQLRSDPGSPKYVNSADTEIFHKGKTLYRLRQAREIAARTRGGEIVVAEGYLDVAAFERAGIPAVAPLGTALTEDQLQLLWKSGVTPLLCFDGDAAGLKAADRAIGVALPHLAPERTIRIAVLPPGLDPDDVFRKSGAEALAPLIAGAAPAVDALFARERARRPLETPEARADFKARLAQAARQIQHEDTRREYDRVLRDKAFEALRGQRQPFQPGPRNGAARGSGRGGREAPPATPTEDLKRLIGAPAPKPGIAVQEDILRYVLDFPFLLDRGDEHLAQVVFRDPDLDRIRHAVLDLRAQFLPVDRETLNAHLRSLGLDTVAERVMGWPACTLSGRDRSASPGDGDGQLADDGLPERERQTIEAEWMAFVTIEAHASPPANAPPPTATLDEDTDAFAAEVRARKERRALEQNALRRGLDPEGGAGLAGDSP